ncbi:MAG TPA: PIN domain-containing protein [Candidatus Omnitrophota bacterium]|nr:PIN domain-containing protein [Candidatus Omnitrophota bacterium]
MIYAKGILLDTAALYAIADSRDKYHSKAVSFLNQIQKSSQPLFISNVTIYEAYRLILHRLDIKKALFFLEEIFDGSIRIEYITTADERIARDCLKKYDDQPFSFVDALNFAVMGRIKIAKVFTFDSHFNIIGFEQMPS